MGAAGDMLMASLLELHENGEEFIKRLNGIGIPNVTVTAEKSVKCGITGTHVRVKVGEEEESEDMHTHEHEHEHEHEHHHEHHHEHSHSGMRDIESIINSLNVSEKVRNDAIAVYTLIAQAESSVHGRSIYDIHFHEVGTMDAIADIVGCCMLIDEIAPDVIAASPVNVGSGQVRCAHGILPVPAPATLHILQDVPIYGSQIKSELCTPTGAALLKHFASSFGEMPIMNVSKVGCGMGTKDFETANCVRAIMGEENEKNNAMRDTVAELCCNIDDMTGEQIGYAVGVLLDAGAADVFTTAISMKKNRPAILLTCLCSESRREEFIKLIFKHTTTIGIREHISSRTVLKRHEKMAQTNYGEVRVKISEGYGVRRVKAEYEDLARIAKQNDISIKDIELIGE
jgi:hypothetical protein